MRFKDIVASYEAEYEFYNELAHVAETELKAAVAAAGIHVQSVSGRAKEPRSFGIKACVGRKYDNPLTEIEDKAGVRVLLLYARDEPRLIDLIGRTFDTDAPERKLDALDYNQVGYLGTHVIGRLRDEQITNAELRGRSFEIQVRTIAQGAWAEVSHEQLYKPPVEVPDSLKRRIYRLVALVELFDDQVEQFRQEAEATEGYAEAQAVSNMTEILAAMGNTRRPDRRLTSHIAAAIGPLYGGDAEQLRETLRGFTEERGAAFENVIREAEALAESEINPLLAQPELPMICERLERDRIRLEQAWPEDVPIEWLDDLAEKWGVGRAPA